MYFLLAFNTIKGSGRLCVSNGETLFSQNNFFQISLIT